MMTLVLLLLLAASSAAEFSVIVNMQRPLHEVDERFLSVCINPRIVTAFDGPFNPRNPKLVTLTSALQPAIFRLGGTSADFLIFDNRKGGMDAAWESLKIKTTNFTMTAEAFDILNTYVQKSGMQLLFDFNLLLRDGENWSTENAKKILQYAIDKDYARNMHFELGNEPNMFPDTVHWSNLSATRIGHDFHILHSLIRDMAVEHPYLNDSLIVGPDITRPREQSVNFLKEFLSVAYSKIDYITFHQYYLNLKTAQLKDFLDYNVMNVLATQIDQLRSMVAKSWKVMKPLWLGESGTCLGTTKGIEFCQRYVGGFLWLDKLGLAASFHIKLIVRQVLYDGVDGLIDRHLNIMPDYWVSVLYKKLVGTRVLEIQKTSLENNVRFYAHCSNKISYSAGAVTYFGMNMLSDHLSLNLTQEHMALEKHVYWLTPGDNLYLVSQYIALNGIKLQLVNDSSLPAMNPVVVGPNQPLILPPYSYGFIVIPNARCVACL